MGIKITVIVLLLVAAFSPGLMAWQTETRFENPSQIMVDRDPINVNGEMMYVSPLICDLDDDGVHELLVGTFSGQFYVFENSKKGNVEPQWLRPSLLKTRDGFPLKLNNWCRGSATPNLVDMNADGFKDIVTATIEGAVVIVAGSDHGWEKPEFVTDTKGNKVCIQMNYDRERSKFVKADRATDDESSKHHMTSVAVVDWDSDGDLDLILGAEEGALYVCENEGVANSPRFAPASTRVKANGKFLELDGGLVNVRLLDWDRDGLFDILCGGLKGNVYWFRNIGVKGQPKFGSCLSLITRRKEPEGELLEAAEEFPREPNHTFHFDAVDYDHDGDLDLLVGGLSNPGKTRKKVELRKEQRDELNALSEQMKAIRSKMALLKHGKTFDEFPKVEASAPFQRLIGEHRELHGKREKLSPSSIPADRIWLYRNVSNQNLK